MLHRLLVDADIHDVRFDGRCAAVGTDQNILAFEYPEVFPDGGPCNSELVRNVLDADVSIS